MSNKASERAIASMSESTKKLNPHLFGAPAAGFGKPLVEVFRVDGGATQSGKRLRQDTKPLMNKLEQEYFNVLTRTHPGNKTIRAQAKRYKLANGAWYKPDITANINGREMAFECKGPKQMKSMARAMLTVKFAAAQWPEVCWALVWKDNGLWQRQEVLS